MENRIYSFLGLARKAGKVVSGDISSKIAINKGKAKLIIVAEDAAERTKREFTRICEQSNIDIRVFGTKHQLGKIIGKENRAVVVVNDKGFSNRLLQMIDGKVGGAVNGQNI